MAFSLLNIKANYFWMLAFITTCCLSMTLEPMLSTIGIYERAAVENGELWRLVLAMFVHLNVTHLMINVVACSALMLMLSEWVSPRVFWAALGFCGFNTVLMLYVFAADVQWYCGLSGALHGVVVWGSLTILHQGCKESTYIPVKKSALLLLCLVAAKLIYEQNSVYTGSNHGFPVLTLSHVYGAIAGAILFFVTFFAQLKHIVQRSSIG